MQGPNETLPIDNGHGGLTVFGDVTFVTHQSFQQSPAQMMGQMMNMQLAMAQAQLANNVKAMALEYYKAGQASLKAQDDLRLEDKGNEVKAKSLLLSSNTSAHDGEVEDAEYTIKDDGKSRTEKNFDKLLKGMIKEAPKESRQKEIYTSYLSKFFEPNSSILKAEYITEMKESPSHKTRIISNYDGVSPLVLFCTSDEPVHDWRQDVSSSIKEATSGVIRKSGLVTGNEIIIVFYFKSNFRQYDLLFIKPKTSQNECAESVVNLYNKLIEEYILPIKGLGEDCRFAQIVYETREKTCKNPFAIALKAIYPSDGDVVYVNPEDVAKNVFSDYTGIALMK